MSAPKIALLLSHPTAPCAQPSNIAVVVTTMDDGSLALHYRVAGQPAGILLPAPLPPGPADGLWQHTCCEAFVAEAGDGYREFNFSPSGQWAAYRFTGYRERDDAFAPADVPTIDFQPLADGFELRATLPAALLPPGNAVQLGLTAVIEAADGSKSYWAHTHCAAQPDFHVRQSFALTLNRTTP